MHNFHHGLAILGKKKNKQTQKKPSDYLYDPVTVTFLKLRVGIQKYVLSLKVLTSSQNADNYYMSAIIYNSLLQKDVLRLG